MIDIKYKKIININPEELQRKETEKFNNRFGFENFIKNHNAMVDHLNKEIV